MIIKVIYSPVSISYYWLPIYLYNEPLSMRVLISAVELILYVFCFYVVTVNLRTFLKIRMFHQNFLILATPMFGLWYELIVAKLITMAYQTRLIGRQSVHIEEFLVLWTDDPHKMWVVDSLEGLEMLVIAGFIEWHYMFSTIFGALSVCTERMLAAMLIDNYESNDQLYIPSILTFLCQFLVISTSYLLLTYQIGIILANAIWISICILSVLMFYVFKWVNQSCQRRMEDPNRKQVFTVSQRYQVKENLRTQKLANRLVFSVLFSIAICGSGILALILDLVPPALCHVTENCLFLNPYLICFVTMYSIPAWKTEFLKAFPVLRMTRKVRVESVEPDADPSKRIELETHIYFEQLNKSWI